MDEEEEEDAERKVILQRLWVLVKKGLFSVILGMVGPTGFPYNFPRTRLRTNSGLGIN